MKIATWNINGIKARREYLLRWLADRQPDVVGLQELKSQDEGFPLEDFEAAGYRAAIHGQKAWNGVAILSRRPQSVMQIGLPGQTDMGARLISVDIHADGGDLSFTTVYVPNGKTLDHEDFPRKLAWLDGLADYMAANIAHRKRAIVCGDFNLCPQPLDSCHGDSANGLIFHTEAERACYRRILDCGFIDMFREKHPDTQTFSWWDYRGGSFPNNRGLRLDFLLATPDVYADLTDISIDRPYRKKLDTLTPSDHAPVIATLENP